MLASYYNTNICIIEDSWGCVSYTVVQHDTIQASASLSNGVLEHMAVTQSLRGSCCCFPVPGHPGEMFLVCIPSPAFEFISFHDF